MSWLRGGDEAATYPQLMLVATLPGVDDRTVNEVMGWLVRCMMQAAAHRTDYLVDMGTAALFGGSRTAELVKLATRVKLIKKVKRSGLDYIEVIQDPAFLHVRLKAEQDWENQRKRDNSNPALTSQVRLRDGDGCRWCGIVTQWGTADQKSARVGTMDHLEPKSTTKGTLATMVVACRHCNSARQDDIESWTTELLPVPDNPYYSPATAAYIAKHRGVQVVVSDPRQRPSDSSPDAPAGERRPPRRSRSLDAPAPYQELPDVDATPGRSAADLTRPSDPAEPCGSLHTGQAPVVGTDDLSASVQTVMHVLGGEPIGSADYRPISADRSPPVSGNVGSGRDGSGSAVGNPPGRESAQRRARRSRRRPR